MKTSTFLAVAALMFSLGCSESAVLGDLVGPESAKAKPDLTVPQVCETFNGTAYFTGLMALCADTEDENTLFLSRRNANRDRWGLIGKLNRAGQKCSEDGNAAGAVEKLVEYWDQVMDLRRSGKILEPAGVNLADAAQALMDGFNPDLTDTPWTCPSGDPAAG